MPRPQSHHAAVQLAVRAAILCACLCVAGIFLPVGEVSVRTPVSTHTRSASLYQLGARKDAAKQFLHKYRGSMARKVGAKALDKLAGKLHGGRIRDGVVDAQDAMATLDALKDEDVDTVGGIIVAVMWSLIGMNALMPALVYGAHVGSRRVRIAAAAVVAAVTALAAIGVHLVVARVASEANAELGAPLFALRGGAYMIPLAAIAGAVAVGVMVAGYVRARARLVAAATAPT